MSGQFDRVSYRDYMSFSGPLKLLQIRAGILLNLGNHFHTKYIYIQTYIYTATDAGRYALNSTSKHNFESVHIILLFLNKLKT